MSLLIFVLIVIVVLALVMWLIYYIPLPPGSPMWLKNFLYVLVLLVAIIIVVVHSGVANAQQRPVPVLKPSPPVAAPVAQPRPAIRQPGQGWQAFKGATRCEQVEGTLTCDNGYKMRIR